MGLEPSMLAVTTEPGTTRWALRQEYRRRIGNLTKAVIPHFKHTYLISGTKAILDCTKYTKDVVLLSFKIEDRIDYVFQEPRACNGTVFGNVSYQEDGNSGLLCQMHEVQR